MLGISGILISAAVLLFLDPLLHLFGGTPDVMPYAIDYTGITAVGIPFYILTTGGCHLIRADRSPGFSMTCMLTGAVINTVLDPLFIFGFGWGIKGGAWATVIGQAVSGILVILYFARFRKMNLNKNMFLPHTEHIKLIVSLGAASFFQSDCSCCCTDFYEQHPALLWRSLRIRKRYTNCLCRNHLKGKYGLPVNLYWYITGQPTYLGI